MASTMSDADTREAGVAQPVGAAMAAYVAAGIGAFALGLIVILNAFGLITVPALYAPSGGVTGRTAFGVVVWLIAWAILHARWKNSDLDVGRMHRITIALVVAGVVLSLPIFAG